MRGRLIAVSTDRHGRTGSLVSAGSDAPRTLCCGSIEQVARAMDALERDESPRWVWWRASDVRALIPHVAPIHRSHELVATHRLLAGGHDDEPDIVWALAQGLQPDARPARRAGDLFDLDPDERAVLPSGFLNPALLDQSWRDDPAHLRLWAALALQTAERQLVLLARRPRAVMTAAAESGAALLCVELEETGLPLDRERLESIITRYAGPRPHSERDELAQRALRDERVLRHATGHEHIDLRNPAQVRRMLHGAGVRVDDTRAHSLEPYRRSYPLVDALLTWRKAERIATTYGWSWLERHVGADDRLRGRWSASDGGAGRMTADAGLHSLPAPMREAVAAAPGHRLVRADLGQVEPRVLAVVSGDMDLARATGADDLYSQVATALGVDRPTAKVAMLAAMYGQTSGPAAQALERMDRSYPVAIRFLRDAADRGERGVPSMTFGGRALLAEPADDPAVRRARGRYARNAVVQGAAAELFKAWALTVRSALTALDGRIVLCLHDELLIHVPSRRAQEAADAVTHSLESAAWHWSGGAPVRFIADVSVIDRWSQAKD